MLPLGDYQRQEIGSHRECLGFPFGNWEGGGGFGFLFLFSSRGIIATYFTIL